MVGVKRVGKFQSCKPSAHWQLPLLSGCVGNCQYCYLNTNLGDKPYVKINVNVEDILNQAQKNILMKENLISPYLKGQPHLILYQLNHIQIP